MLSRGLHPVITKCLHGLYSGIAESLHLSSIGRTEAVPQHVLTFTIQGNSLHLISRRRVSEFWLAPHCLTKTFLPGAMQHCVDNGQRESFPSSDSDPCKSKSRTTCCLHGSLGVWERKKWDIPSPSHLRKFDAALEGPQFNRFESEGSEQ